MTETKEKVPLGEVTNKYPTLKETGEFIRHARESHGISQEILASKIFVSRKAVSKWETGKGYPQVDTLAPLAEALNISIDEMLIGRFMKKEEEDSTNKKGIINHIISLANKRYVKRTVRLIILMLFILLSIFFVTNYNAVKVYKVFFDSEDLRVQNGLIVTTRYKEYINIGSISNDFEDIDDNTKITYTLYIGDKNNILKELQKFNINTKQPYLSNSNYQEMPELNISKNYDNLYMKVEYINNENKNVSFTVKLDVVLKYRSNDYFPKKNGISGIAAKFESGNNELENKYNSKMINNTYKIDITKIVNLYNKENINQNNKLKIKINKNEQYIKTNYKTYIVKYFLHEERLKIIERDKQVFNNIVNDNLVCLNNKREYDIIFDILGQL